jgi:hypothetical protein
MLRGAVAAVFVLLLAGCGGAEGQRAQELLAQAEAASRQVTSASYEMEFSFSAKGQNIGLYLEGSGYLKGPRAGEQTLEMRGTGPFAGVGAFEFAIIGNQAHARVNGRWQSVPIPAVRRNPPQLGPDALAKLTPYVKRVSVQEGQFVNGERIASVAGVIDTEGLVKAIAGLDAFSSIVGQSGPDLTELAEHLGDVHAVLAISERTHLLRSAVIDLTVEIEGEEIAVQAIYRLKDVNKPVRLPRLS